MLTPHLAALLAYSPPLSILPLLCAQFFDTKYKKKDKSILDWKKFRGQLGGLVSGRRYDC
jgi:hypothetical protein